MKILGKKILVTGGAGFIGSHLVEELVKLGADVTVIDNLSRGNKKNLTSVKDRISFFNADLRIEKKVLPLFQNQEIIFNLAALNTGVDFDEGRTQVMFEENMLLQMIPLRVAGKTKSVKKFIQVSSASVYSRDAMENHVPTPETADTTDPEPSKLGYAIAKKMGEHLARWYAENSSLWTVSARFINVYGDRDNSDSLGHFIPVMIRKVIHAKKEVLVFGSGKQKRSFIFVSDVISALLVLLEKGQKGETYNIDAQEERSVKEVVQSIIKILGKNKVKMIFDKTKPEGSQRRMLENKKLQNLGWKPKISFEDGLKRTISSMTTKTSR